MPAKYALAVAALTALSVSNQSRKNKVSFFPHGISNFILFSFSQVRHILSAVL
jgi:hypothetical protein